MLRIVSGVVSLVVVGLLSVSIASAAEKGPGKGGKRPEPEQVFKMIAKGGDSFSLADFKESPLGKRLGEKAEPFFKNMDANGDGKVTLEEFKAAHAKREGGKKHGEGKKQ